MPDPFVEVAQESQMNGAMLPMASAPAVDPHGRAALLLVESLIHALVEKAVISRGEAIDIIDIAVDVEAALADAAEVDGFLEKSLLAPLATTFRIEISE